MAEVIPFPSKLPAWVMQGGPDFQAFWIAQKRQIWDDSRAELDRTLEELEGEMPPQQRMRLVASGLASLQSIYGTFEAYVAASEF